MYLQTISMTDMVNKTQKPNLFSEDEHYNSSLNGYNEHRYTLG